MANIGQKIKERRIALGMTQEDLAFKMGYRSKSTINKIELGINDIPQSKIIQFASVLHTTVAYLMDWEEAPQNTLIYEKLGISPIPQKKKLPLLGNVACGEPIFAEECVEGYVDADMEADFCLRAKGDSMINARIHDGDIVFVHQQDAVDNGEIAVVLIEDEATIKELQKSAVFRNTNMAAAHMVQAQAEAMKNAASNENGAMMGFMGMNMAQAAGGLNANALYQMGAQQPAAAANSWQCKCGAVNTGKFCTECGASNGWTCSCGSVNKGKFCPECGAKKPESEPKYICDKCGWEPADPKNPPKFCPECGDRFDENDLK